MSIQKQQNDYPFHTTEFEGQEMAGIAFQASTGRFLEFVDPSEHDEWLKLRDPRDGKEFDYDGKLGFAWRGNCVSGMVGPTMYPAEKWAEYRDTYANSNNDDYEQWEDMWDEIHSMNPDE